MFKENDIVHETKSHWVGKVGVGHYEVLESKATHSVRVATFHFSSKPDYALSRAIAHCDRLSA